MLKYHSYIGFASSNLFCDGILRYSCCKKMQSLHYIIVGMVVMCTLDDVSLDGNVTAVLSRKKRYVVFPSGSVLQLGYCLTVPALIPNGIWNYGWTLGTNWQLPSDPSVLKKRHRQGILHRRDRRQLYSKLTPFLNTLGMDGHACILRALCEAGQRSTTIRGKGTFLEEIFHVLFTLPTGAEDNNDEDGLEVYDAAHRRKHNCARSFPSCPSSLTEIALPSS